MPSKKSKTQRRKRAKRGDAGEERLPPSQAGNDDKGTDNAKFLHWKKAKLATCHENLQDVNVPSTSLVNDVKETTQTEPPPQSKQNVIAEDDTSSSLGCRKNDDDGSAKNQVGLKLKTSLVEVPTGTKLVHGRPVEVITCFPSLFDQTNRPGTTTTSTSSASNHHHGCDRNRNLLRTNNAGDDVKEPPNTSPGLAQVCPSSSTKFAYEHTAVGKDNLVDKLPVVPQAPTFPVPAKVPLGFGKKCSQNCPRCHERIHGPKIELPPAHKSKLRRDHGKSICQKFQAKVEALYERRWYHQLDVKPAYFSDKWCPKEWDAYKWRLRNPSPGEVDAARKDGHDTSKGVPRKYIKVDRPSPLPLPQAVRYGDEPLPTPEELNLALMESLQEATMELPTSFYF